MTVYEQDTRFDHRARIAAVAKADAWTAAQAARLDTTPAVILESIRERAWLPDQIERVDFRYSLEGIPPPLTGVEPWVDAQIDRAHKAKVKAQNSPTTRGIAPSRVKDRAA